MVNGVVEKDYITQQTMQILHGHRGSPAYLL